MRRANNPILDGIPNIVTIYFNMFGTFMKNQVMSNVKSGLTVTKQFHGVRVRDPKIKKECFKPLKFRSSDLYSASEEERETVCCFLVFQDIGELPRNTSQPVRDRRVNRQLAQSESHQAERDKSQCERSRIP